MRIRAAGVAVAAGAARSCRRWSIWRYPTGSLPRLDFPELGVAADRSLRLARARRRRTGRGARRSRRARGDAGHRHCFAGHRLRSADQRSRLSIGRISGKSPNWRKPRRPAGRIDTGGPKDIAGGLAVLFAQGAASDRSSPLSAEGRAAISAHGLLIVCSRATTAVPARPRKAWPMPERARRPRRAHAQLPRDFRSADELSDHRGAAG